MVTDPLLLQSIHSSANILAASGRFESIVKNVLENTLKAIKASGAAIYFHQKRTHKLKIHYILPDKSLDQMVRKDFPENYGIIGKVFTEKKPIITSGFTNDFIQNSELLTYEKFYNIAVRNAITLPLINNVTENPIGIIQFFNKKDNDFDENDLLYLEIISIVMVMSQQNSKLLEENNRASQLLGMGKVAHDIKNLAHALEANVVFSDQTINELRKYVSGANTGSDDTLLSYVDSINYMYDELTDSIERVKRYSGLISDLSSGSRLKPTMKLIPLAQSIQLGAAYLESEGRSHYVGFRYDIQYDAPPTMHDEMFISRMVQNLVNNAVWATHQNIIKNWDKYHHDENGDEFSIFEEIHIKYRYKDKEHILDIIDPGCGMTPEISESIMQGNALSYWQQHTGSGWGTKIVLELAATHNAKVTVKSKLGKGTIIKVVFPHVDKIEQSSL